MTIALVASLAKLIRRSGNLAALHETVRNIYSERAEAAIKRGLYVQIAEIIEAEGVEVGAAIIRSLAEGTK